MSNDVNLSGDNFWRDDAAVARLGFSRTLTVPESDLRSFVDKATAAFRIAQVPHMADRADLRAFLPPFSLYLTAKG